MSALVYSGVAVGNPAVVRDFSLVLEAGDTVVLSGGVGKFSLLKLALGLGQMGAGSVRTLGQDPFALSATELGLLRARCALVPHTGALISNLSVAANGTLPLQYHGLCSDREAEERVVQALVSLEIDHLAGLRPASLTYAEQRLAALARAVATRPDILLIQDPFEGLEESMRPRVDAQLRQLATAGCASLIATPVLSLDTAYDGRLAPGPHRRVLRLQAEVPSS